MQKRFEIRVGDLRDVFGVKTRDDAVDDEEVCTLLKLGELFVKIHRFLDAAGVGAGDHEKMRARVAQDELNELATLLQGFLQVLKGVEELHQVVHKALAKHLGDEAQDDGARVEHTSQQAGFAVGQEPLDDALIEEGAGAARGFEKLQGVFGGRGVENHQVEVAAGVKVVQLLQRHVLLHPVQGRGEQAEDVVFFGPVQCAFVGRKPVD